MEIDDGDIESAVLGADQRLAEQEPWLRLLPTDFSTVLDVGAGAGKHSKWFLESGRRPVALDRYGDAFLFKGEIEIVHKDLSELDDSRQFDAVFCSHVLEHFPDPGAAISHMRSLIKPDGYLFVIVPPYSPLVVNYHWHTGWNCAQLATLLAALGFDCSEATFMQMGLNVCGWGRKMEFEATRFNLRRSLPHLPAAMSAAFYVRDGYEFLPGDIIFADQNTAHFAPTFSHLEIPDFDPLKGIELTFGDTQEWRSKEWSFAESGGVDLSDGKMRVAFAVKGATAPALRLAISSGEPAWSDVTELYLSATPGLSCHTFAASDLQVRQGAPNFREIRNLSLGGFGAGVSVRIWCVLPDDRLLG